MVLRFNFSAFKTALDGLEHYFEEYCQLRFRNALERNPDLFPEATVRGIRAPASVNGQLNELFAYAGDHGIPLYALIEEYDNFGQHGAGPPRRGGVPDFHARRWLLPQLLRHPEGRHRGGGRRAGAPVHHPASRPSPWTT